MAQPKILYLTKEAAPSPDERLEIAQLGFPVQLRNFQHAGTPETHDGVLFGPYISEGDIDRSVYAKSPDGEEVFKKFKANEIKEIKRQGQELSLQRDVDDAAALELQARASKDDKALAAAAKAKEAAAAKLAKVKAAGNRPAFVPGQTTVDESKGADETETE